MNYSDLENLQLLTFLFVIQSVNPLWRTRATWHVPHFCERLLQRWMKNCVFLESSELFIAFDANTKELFKIIWWATKIDEFFIDDIYLKVTIDIHDWSLFFCWNKDYSCSCFKFSLWNSTILMLIVRYHWGEDEHIRLMQCYQIIVAGYLLLNGLCQSV